jgi:hypothetical protein
MWGLRGAAILALVYSLYLLSQRDYSVKFLGDVTPVTLAIVALLYVTAEVSMTHSKMGKLDAVVASLVFAFAYVQTYELVYHFTFPIYLNYFKPISLSGPQTKYLITMVAPIIPILLFRKHLSFKWTSVVFLSAFVAIWSVWILYGYPQCIGDAYYYPQIFKGSDACGLSIPLNSSAKVTLAAVYASLLNYNLIFALTKDRMLSLKDVLWRSARLT